MSAGSRDWPSAAGASRGDFEPVGLFCPTDGEVASVADMNARVAGLMESKVPGLAPESARARGEVVGIDRHCRSGHGR